MKSEEKYTIAEIIKQLNPVLNDNFVLHTLHLFGELGEIAEFLVKAQDNVVPTTTLKVSEITNPKEQLTEAQLEEYFRFTSFFRWNAIKDQQRFFKRLTSELADVVMMVAIYPIWAKRKQISFPFSYEFGVRKNRNKGLIAIFGDIIKLLGNIYDTSVKLESSFYKGHEEKLIFPEFLQDLVKLLGCVEELCSNFKIDIKEVITNKLIELKKQKRCNE